MIKYLQLYPERLAKCREIIEDAKNTGYDQDIRESYEAIGRLFVAAMAYAFEDEQPGFSRRSFEGGEWQSWRDDVDRSAAKSARMRELGAIGGQASGKARQAKTGEQSNRNEATLQTNEATLDINVATLQTNEAALEIGDEKRSSNTKTNTKANANTNTKTNTKANSEYAKPLTVAEDKAVGDNKTTKQVKDEQGTELSTITETFPQADADNSAATIGCYPEVVDTFDTNLILRSLCDEFPDVRSAGFRAELRQDVEDEGPDFVRRCLLEADKANSREKLSVPFYRAIKKRLQEEILADGIAAGREYAKRMARLPA